MKIKNAPTVSNHFVPRNSNGKYSGTFLTENTCVTAPEIGGGDHATGPNQLRTFAHAIVQMSMVQNIYNNVTRI